MNSKIIAVGAVLVIVIAAAGAYVVVNKDSTEYEYDPSLGWKSWNPVVTETKTAYFSISPLLMAGTEKLFTEIYGKTVDYSKYKLSDVPADFLKYDSLVLSNTDDKVVIASTIRENTDQSGKKVVETTVNKCPDNLLTTSGYAATLYGLLSIKYGEKQAETMLWDYVYGLDKSSWSTASMETLYGLPIPDGIVKVETTYSLIDNKEKYAQYIGEATADGQTMVMMMAGSLKNNYSDMGPFYDMVNATNGAASPLFFFSNGVNDVLAAVEVIGAVYGLEDEAQEYIDMYRLNMYAIHCEAEKAKKGYTVYLESNSGTAAGRGTITAEVFEILCLENINTTNQWQTIPEETIIEKRPSVIIFYDNNSKSWDERLRVGVGQV